MFVSFHRIIDGTLLALEFQII